MDHGIKSSSAIINQRVVDLTVPDDTTMAYQWDPRRGGTLFIKEGESSVLSLTLSGGYQPEEGDTIRVIAQGENAGRMPSPHLFVRASFARAEFYDKWNPSFDSSGYGMQHGPDVNREYTRLDGEWIASSMVLPYPLRAKQSLSWKALDTWQNKEGITISTGSWGITSMGFKYMVRDTTTQIVQRSYFGEPTIGSSSYLDVTLPNSTAQETRAPIHETEGNWYLAGAGAAVDDLFWRSDDVGVTWDQLAFPGSPTPNGTLMQTMATTGVYTWFMSTVGQVWTAVDDIVQYWTTLPDSPVAFCTSHFDCYVVCDGGEVYRIPDNDKANEVLEFTVTGITPRTIDSDDHGNLLVAGGFAGDTNSLWVRFAGVWNNVLTGAKTLLDARWTPEGNIVIMRNRDDVTSGYTETLFSADLGESWVTLDGPTPRADLQNYAQDINARALMPMPRVRSLNLYRQYRSAFMFRGQRSMTMAAGTTIPYMVLDVSGL